MQDRRQFLAALSSSALVSLSPGAPIFLHRAAAAENSEQAEQVLVVVQLTGGNDGLNTVVPYADELYRRNRYTLIQPEKSALMLGSGLGLHPSMKGFSSLFDAGRLAIVQGVGYPNPDRSHFSSMDVWHTARQTAERQPVGWLGRYLDLSGKPDGRDVPGVHLGSEKQPLALSSRGVPALSLESLDQLRSQSSKADPLRAAMSAALPHSTGSDDLLGFLGKSAAASRQSAQRIEEAVAGQKSAAKYPSSPLAGKLQSIAQLIDAGLTTRIYYVALDGFDTHSAQAPAHAALLGQLSEAIKAFVDDLQNRGQLDRVLLMTFSEFGRRVKENASGGTDHGAAAPMFLTGGKLKAGLIGPHPKLDDLIDGDLKHHTDFRQVYAAVLDGWLHSNSSEILGQQFKRLELFQS